jgi:hypothetical protein
MSLEGQSGGLPTVALAKTANCHGLAREMVHQYPPAGGASLRGWTDLHILSRGLCLNLRVSLSKMPEQPRTEVRGHRCREPFEETGE